MVVEADLSVLIIIGVALVFIGIILIVAAIIRSSVGNKEDKDSRVRGAGVIMIGPIPIIFGTDKNSVKTVVALALALSIVVLIIFVAYYWLLR